MDYFSLIFLIVGLSFDDFALALAIGLLQSKKILDHKWKYIFQVACAFTLPTVILPLIGLLIGILFTSLFESISDWLVVLVFCVIGLWIIKEAFEKKDQLKFKEKNLFSFWVLIIIGVLSSIDEAAIGITFIYLSIPIYIILLFLFIVNFLFCMIGVKIGLTSKFSNNKIYQIIAGCLLIAIGFKSFLEIFL